MKIRTSTLAAAALLVLSTATACSGADRAVCDEAAQAFRDYSGKAAGAMAKPEELNKAASELSARLTELSAKADGDLKTALASMAESWSAFKIDTSDPASLTKLTEFSTKVSQATQDLGKACG